MTITLIHGDCRMVMPTQGLVDVVIADPPYGDTSLEWDKRVVGWLGLVRATLKPSGSFWCFGSLRFFMAHAAEFEAAGFRCSQDVIWEKQNGSGFQADRFKRVHENAVHFYPKDVAWEDVYKNPVKTMDAVARKITRSKGGAHMKAIAEGTYETEDGGPRLQRSVIYARSCHGFAEHPTQKPEAIVEPLVEYSCPPGGIVGDWFAGSGTVGVVAAKTGRGYVGCETDPAYHALAMRRLSEARLDIFAGRARSGPISVGIEPPRIA